MLANFLAISQLKTKLIYIDCTWGSTVEQPVTVSLKHLFGTTINLLQLMIVIMMGKSLVYFYTKFTFNSVFFARFFNLKLN